MRVISHSRVCDGVQSLAEPGGVLSPEGLLPAPPLSDQQSRGQRHIQAQSCRAQAHLAGWHGQGGAGVQGSCSSACGCWPPPHWPCSGDNGIGAFHWMPLAPNQYYRKSSVSSGTSLTGSDSVHFVDDDKSQRGLPEVAESTWWFKSFFQSEQTEKTSLLVVGMDRRQGSKFVFPIPTGTNNNYLLQYKESQLLGEMADPRT
ncbi:hypothetical protein DBR06_SOUSAS6210008, partial [Sousa chinensis]